MQRIDTKEGQIKKKKKKISREAPCPPVCSEHYVTIAQKIKGMQCPTICQDQHEYWLVVWYGIGSLQKRLLQLNLEKRTMKVFSFHLLLYFERFFSLCTARGMMLLICIEHQLSSIEYLRCLTLFSVKIWRKNSS